MIVGKSVARQSLSTSIENTHQSIENSIHTSIEDSIAFQKISRLISPQQLER